ncbi:MULTISPECIES: hypothetical protein [Roseobacteraceae]|uniref:hypothetical protein n=1 Tax=Roseobacteraceae TaxID=2854170 RepID=UPI00125FFDBC|nr:MULTISPECIES: hypothetical protein [Roseobacteraceae]KAB6717068.1 hypothetical protein C8029_06780 [Roseobacter sp. TSBP12]|tara:strand:- start:3368 stop:3580 length:213 start_codon:yes stop_codon:yes gene_type:complete
MTHNTVFDAHHRHHDPLKNHRLVQFAKLDCTARRHPMWDQLSRADRPDTQSAHTASRVVHFLRVARGHRA